MTHYHACSRPRLVRLVTRCVKQNMPGFSVITISYVKATNAVRVRVTNAIVLHFLLALILVIVLAVVIVIVTVIEIVSE